MNLTAVLAEVYWLWDKQRLRLSYPINTVFHSDSRSLYSRVVHEVVDLPHGDSAHVDEEDEPQQHQVVFRRHPQHELQVEGVQLGQQELGGASRE